MRLFPTKKFTAELRSDYSISMQNLKSNTDITYNLISDYTKKEFRGQVNEKGFKLISSEIGSGAICVLIGKFEGKNGKIEVRIHNAFKVMFLILMLMPFFIFVFEVITNGIQKSLGFTVPLVMVIVFGRLIIELSFRYISNTGINKLIQILGITELNKK